MGNKEVMRKPNIATFYRPEMVYSGGLTDESKSPQKPKLLLEYLEYKGLGKHFVRHGDFPNFSNEDFLIAHTRDYVEGFFAGRKPYCDCHGVLGIDWTPEFATTVRYTNASLYYAIKHSLNDPKTVAFSPTSGFHHATPKSGALFCAFSGQVIASVRLYRESGVSGAYIDLDGHFGNSIEDSRDFVPELNVAVPPGWNINLKSHHEEYLENLKILLGLLKQEILGKRLHYLVFCHGADSHEDDDLGEQLTTKEWVECSRIFYEWVERIETETQRSIPLTVCLFGGYRSDDFNSVLSLHTADLVACLNILCKHRIDYKLEMHSR